MSKIAIYITPLLLIPWALFGVLSNQTASAANPALAMTDRFTPFACATPPSKDDKPIYNSYKGVTIGMPTGDARLKLGTPKDKADDQDFYVYSDNESVQVIYDAAHTVNAISVNYLGDLKAIPSPHDIFGADVAAKPDGSIFKLVRYPKAGYWVSYNRTAGEDPMIIVTMQKIQAGQ